MKKTFLLLLLASAPAMACPNFAGNYRGANNDKLSQVVTQDSEKVQFGHGAVTMITDGQEHSIDQQGVKLTYKVTCSQNKMEISLVGVLPNGQTVTGSNEVTQTPTGYDSVGTGAAAGNESWARVN